MAKVADAVIVCALVLVLDMAAGLLGLVQAARNQQVNNCDLAGRNGTYNWPPYRYRFGVAACVLFVAAYVSSNIAGRCDYLCPQMKDIRASLSKRMNLLKWISMAVFLVGGLLLIFGTRWCKFLHGHAVGIGAILCFVHGGIIIAFYMPAIVLGCRREAPSQENP